MIRLKATKGGAKKRQRTGTKFERGLQRLQNSHAMGGRKAIGANPEYYPPRKKLKGWQRDSTGKKVA